MTESKGRLIIGTPDGVPSLRCDAPFLNQSASKGRLGSNIAAKIRTF